MTWHTNFFTLSLGRSSKGKTSLLEENISGAIHCNIASDSSANIEGITSMTDYSAIPIPRTRNRNAIERIGARTLLKTKLHNRDIRSAPDRGILEKRINRRTSHRDCRVR